MNKPTFFSESERRRYARHFSLKDVGEEGQKRLKKAKVLCIGAGGLGSPLLLYLAAAGVGEIGICDFDLVSESNLQRQILFSKDDIGKSKSETAKARLIDLNPHIKYNLHNEKLTSENALFIFEKYDIIADGSDNFPTRYLVNDACVLTRKPCVFGAVSRFEGQISVFNLKREDKTFGPNYRDIFPEPPAPGTVLNCEEAGVLGVLPGIIGSMQANEVIKIITEIGESLDGRLFLFDAASFTSRILKIRKNPALKIEKLIDYDFFCGLKVPEISQEELNEMLIKEEDFQLIDVREKEEYQQENIGGELMPLSEFEQHVAKISRSNKIVIHCQSGKRSLVAVGKLLEKGFENVYSLKGGMLGFRELKTKK
jgi:molybdopterin/thiamine biosynthesis adenylyltransferase/rhodanese-related sulfurtransferase